MHGQAGRTSVEEARPLYASFAWAYDMVVAHPAGGFVGDAPRSLGALGVAAGAAVIDAGCGTGRYTHALAQAGFRVTGVDRSEALIDQARTRSTNATFVCADLLTWRPSRRVDGVLCRGVLNDLIADSDRSAAFGAFASWLRPDGVLFADVRDWQATVARYARQRRYERSVREGGRTLNFCSETELDGEIHLMRVRERYVGTVDGDAVDDSYEFVMRCWTPEEVEACVTEAGFASVEVRTGSTAGLPADRLCVVARANRDDLPHEAPPTRSRRRA